MFMQTQHYKYRGQDKWVDQTKAWFKDDADVANWQDVFRKTDVCWKVKGGRFLVRLSLH